MSVSLVVFYLSFFSEVVETEILRRLILSLLTHACYNKNDDCYNVGEHFEELLSFCAETLNVVVCITESTEEE